MLLLFALVVISTKVISSLSPLSVYIYSKSFRYSYFNLILMLQLSNIYIVILTNFHISHHCIYFFFYSTNYINCNAFFLFLTLIYYIFFSSNSPSSIFIYFMIVLVYYSIYSILTIGLPKYTTLLVYLSSFLFTFIMTYSSCRYTSNS